MSTITVKDKKFEIFVPEEIIHKSINRLANQIKIDLGDKNPLFICVLNGAFMFASDLTKSLNFPCEIDFIQLKSYQGISSSGEIKKTADPVTAIKGRHIVIIEDIIDTGNTIQYLKEYILRLQPESLRIATLLLKPEALQTILNIDYIGFKVPNEFIIGYGLDYDGLGRNLRNLYKIKD